MNAKQDFQVDLTGEQVAFFLDNGYLSIPRITTDEEVEWLKGIYDELFTDRTGKRRDATLIWRVHVHTVEGRHYRRC